MGTDHSNSNESRGVDITGISGMGLMSFFPQEKANKGKRTKVNNLYCIVKLLIVPCGFGPQGICEKIIDVYLF